MREHLQLRRSSVDKDPARRWAAAVGLGSVVGLGYFLAARLSLNLMEPDGVAVFWPAAGVSSGVLIALGPRARWPVAIGVMVATLVANLMGDRNLAASAAFAFCNAAEALITAGLIHYYFGRSFRLYRLRSVAGFTAAAVIGAMVSGIGGTIGYKLFHSPTAPILTTWWHWFASDSIGIVAFAPVVIGLAAKMRNPPSRREIAEGIAGLVMLVAMTGIVLSLPHELWNTVAPAALLFPMLWLAACCRAIFAAAGTFIVSLTVVWTTILGIGHFGDTDLPLSGRILQAQAVILVLTLLTLVLAALFAERRRHEEELTRGEARLAHANQVLERERDNKLMSLEAAMGAIAHQMRQPLSVIAMNGQTGQILLERAPPDIDGAKEILAEMLSANVRANGVLDSIRALFRTGIEDHGPLELNGLLCGVLKSLQGELERQRITVRAELASELPNVRGHSGQLQEVIRNLIQNAIDAMETVSHENRLLCVKTERSGTDKIAVSVEDSGPGIAPQDLARMFDAFVTTKANGMGLGLAISNMIIARHNGVLTASSDGKKGAVFRVVLPIAHAHEAPVAPIPQTMHLAQAEAVAEAG